MTGIATTGARPRRVVPPLVGALRKFVSTELSSPVRFSQPGLLVRGYQSDRRWQYPERPTAAKGYVSDFVFARRVGELNPAHVRAEFLDKLAFAEKLRANGLGHRMPRMLGVSRDGRFEPTADPSGGQVVIKPVDGRAGQGLAVFDSLDEAVAACPRGRTFLVQERVRAHAYGAEIFPDSLNCLRVQTFRPAPAEGPRVAVVVHRIGRRATAPGDAFTTGGLVARVTPDGTLTYAVGPVRERRRERHDRHPETGAQIAGRTVPFHHEASALALELMGLYPQAAYIGWDIAISADGPVVLEGNASWPNLLMLQAHGPFADAPDVRSFFVERRMLRRS